MSCSIVGAKRSGSISREQIPDLSGFESNFRSLWVLSVLKFYKPHIEVHTSQGLKDKLVPEYAQGWGLWLSGAKIGGEHFSMWWHDCSESRGISAAVIWMLNVCFAVVSDQCVLLLGLQSVGADLSTKSDACLISEHSSPQPPTEIWRRVGE